jgi:predicted nuclease of predicted toxin-antitoxin system
MIELEACDTLLATSKLMLANRDSMIVEKDVEIFGLSNQLILKEKIISSKDSDIKDLNLKLDNATNANKWLKIGWISTGAVLVLSIILGR